MTRTARVDRPVEKTLSIPASVTHRVDDRLTDRMSGKVPYGAWATLVVGLLEKWLSDVDKAEREARLPGENP
jgi:hypothetical protein